MLRLVWSCWKIKTPRKVSFLKDLLGCWCYKGLLELDSGKWVFGYTESIFPVLACINSIASIVCFWVHDRLLSIWCHKDLAIYQMICSCVRYIIIIHPFTGKVNGIEKGGSFTLSPLSLAVFPLVCHRLLKASSVSHTRFRIWLPNQYLSWATV